MNTIGAASMFVLLTLNSLAGAKSDYWHAPLLTLSQAQNLLLVGQTRDAVLRTLPFNTEAVRMPHTGSLDARTEMFYPKGEDQIVFTQGLFCLFENGTEILRDSHAWKPRYLFYIQLRKLSSLRRELVGPND